MKDWKDWRAENIGGSEIAALFNECPYSSAYKLWHEKKGDLPPSDLEEDPRVQAGSFLEAGIIEWCNHVYATTFYQPKVYVTHTAVEGMGCTPDAFSKMSKTTIAQVKNVDAGVFRNQWVADGNDIIKAPLHIYLQCQHELACCNAQTSWLIVAVGGNRLYKMIIERDDELISMIELKVAEFWKSIKDGIEPEPDYKSDSEAIKTMASLQYCEDWTDLSGDDILLDTIEEYISARNDRIVSEENEQRFKNKLIYLYGEYSNVTCGNHRIKIKPDKNGNIRIYHSTNVITF